MRRKLLGGILGLEAAVCVLMCVTRWRWAGAVPAVLAFPLEQIGAGLRALSLSGSMGNAVAIGLYGALCLLPAAALPLLRRRRQLHGEDALLGLLSVTLFGVLYGMINPGLLGAGLSRIGGAAMEKGLLGGAAYSVLLSYGVMRALRALREADGPRLQKYLGALLGALGVLFVYLACGASLSGYLEALDALRAGNAGNEGRLGLSCAFLAVRHLLEALPYVLDVLVVFAALRLLEALRTDRYSEQAVAAAGRLARLCGAALSISLLSGMAFNLVQLLFAASLQVIDGSVQLPLLSVAFVFAALLLARFIGENKQLKDDNDGFI